MAAVNQLGFGGVVPALPLYAKSFGVSASAIGLSVGVYGPARFYVPALCGQLSGRMGRVFPWRAPETYCSRSKPRIG